MEGVLIFQSGLSRRRALRQSREPCRLLLQSGQPNGAVRPCSCRTRLVGVDRRVLGLLLTLDGHLALRVLALDTRFGLAPFSLQPRLAHFGRLLGNETLLFGCELTFPRGDLGAGAFLLSLSVEPGRILDRVRLALVQLAFALQLLIPDHRTGDLLRLAFQTLDEPAGAFRDVL
jgi:hypothetical protein